MDNRELVALLRNINGYGSSQRARYANEAASRIEALEGAKATVPIAWLWQYGEGTDEAAGDVRAELHRLDKGAKENGWRETPLFAAPVADKQWRPARYRIEHDGFVGTQIGEYTRLDGKRGAVLQQDGTNIVHVYGEKWLVPVETAEGE